MAYFPRFCGRILATCCAGRKHLSTKTWSLLERHVSGLAPVIINQRSHSQHVHPKPYPFSLDTNPGMVGRLIEMYDTFLVDCDGVLWGMDHVTEFENIAKSIEKLRGHGKRLVFVTNNSIHSRDDYCEKFRKMCGFEVAKNEVFGVCHAAAVYLKSIARIQGKVYMIGSQGMSVELDQVGLENIGCGADPDPITDHKEELLAQTFDEDVQAVLVGFDIHISYNKIYKAASYLSKDNSVYVATNAVETWVRIGENRVKPLTGVMNAAINAASARQPIVIGKPNSHLMACVMAEYPDIDLSRTIMIGDSMRTDVTFAYNAGIDSLLVLTGVTNINMVKQSCETGQLAIPNYILPSFTKFGELL